MFDLSLPSDQACLILEDTSLDKHASYHHLRCGSDSLHFLLQLFLLLRRLFHAVCNDLVTLFKPELSDLSYHLILRALPFSELILDLDD